MNKEELDSFEELNINLQDIDDLDMGLEIISYKVRKSLQELADIIINQSCQISTYKDKEDKLIDKIKATTPLELAIMFHDTYEELAPQFNYETRKDTKEFDENSNNGKLMIAVCSKLLDLIKEYEDEKK